MKNYLPAAAALIVILSVCCTGQTPELERAQAQVNKVLEDSGRHFRDGLNSFKANQRSESGARFDKSVEVFLYSTLNIQKDQKLLTCYTQLVETIYRIEFPSDAQQPQIRSLSASCGWRWNDEDFKLADAVASMVKPSAKKTDDAALAAAAGRSGAVPVEGTSGFNTAEFQPSPLDELSRLELTADEVFVDRSAAPRGHRALKVVRAQAGDTVAKLATRHNANPVEVAKFNGLFPNSALGTGRELKLPDAGNSYIPYARPAVSVGADDTCKAIPTPAVQNLQLGMNPAQISNRLNRKIIPTRVPGSFFRTTYAFVHGSRGANNIGLVFYEGRLYRIGVEYDSSIKWHSLSEFQIAVARALKTPLVWRVVSSEERRLICKEFEIEVGKTPSGKYRLVLSDPVAFGRMYDAWKTALRKAEEDQAKRKRSFKP